MGIGDRMRNRRRRGEGLFNPGAFREENRYRVGVMGGTRDPRTGRVLPGMEEQDAAAWEEWRASGESDDAMDRRWKESGGRSAYRRGEGGGRGGGAGLGDPVPSGMYGDPGMIDYSPQYEDSLNPRFQLGESQESRAQADVGAMRSQRQALRNLEETYARGGWTAAEQMQLQQAQLQLAQQERGQREAIQQNAAARGMAGGGVETMGALAAQQGSANAAHGWASEIAREGAARAARALEAQASLSSGMRDQSFDEARTRGAAADAFTRSNVDYARGAESRNVDRTNTQRERRADLPLTVWGMQHGAAMDLEAARERRKARQSATRQSRADYILQGLGMLGGAITAGASGGGSGSGTGG